MLIEEVPVAETHGLRRTVLRDGRMDVGVEFLGEDEPETFHLAARSDGGEVVGIATFLVRECPARPGVDARQLRGMAVAEERRGAGLGAALLRAGVERCGAAGSAVLWAHARLTAVPWYERHGLSAVGDVYVFGEMDLPHRLVVREL